MIILGGLGITHLGLPGLGPVLETIVHRIEIRGMEFAISASDRLSERTLTFWPDSCVLDTLYHIMIK